MITINSNALALFAQRQRQIASSTLSEAVERLSSSYRVNSAKDDAAGLAIGNRMQSQRAGQTQAQRNTGDGVSLVRTAHSALDAINTQLQRVRELSVRGANGVLSEQDSDIIQNEINACLREITRITEISTFNSEALLTGTPRQLPLQVGANDGEILNIDLGEPNFSLKGLQLNDFAISGLPGQALPVNTIIGLANGILVNDPSTTVIYPATGGTNQTLVRAGVNFYIRDNAPSYPNGVRYFPTTVDANYDTHTRQSVIEFQTLSNEAFPLTTTTPPRAVGATTDVDYLGTDGLALTNQSGKSVAKTSDGRYWIVEGGDFYAATLSYGVAGSGKVQAQMADGVALTSADFPVGSLPQAVTHTPSVSLALSNVELKDSANVLIPSGNGRLLNFGSGYLLEVKNGSAYEYFQAAEVKTVIHADGTSTISAKTGAASLDLAPVEELHNTATVTLEAGRIDVTYIDSNGNISYDVMAEDTAGNYYFDVEKTIDGVTAPRQVTLTTLDDGTYLLRYSAGDNELPRYSRAHLMPVSDPATGLTTLTVREIGPSLRLKYPPDPITALDRALSSVADKRSYFGAIENRLESTINNLGVSINNLAAAQSRILDADYAIEVSKMTRALILQQSSSALLSQANQIAQTVVDLLK